MRKKNYTDSASIKRLSFCLPGNSVNPYNLILLSVVAAGIASICTQLITVREFLCQFYGNEITISLVLFSWLMVSGLGSLSSKLFRKPSLTVYSILVLAIAIIPLGEIVLIRLLRDTIFIHGESPGFYPVFFFIFFLSAPYAFLIGFILPYSLTIIKTKKSGFTSGHLYLTDNIGDITGGVLFSFVLVYFLTPFKIIALSSSILILSGLTLLIQTRQRYSLFIGALVPIIIFFVLGFHKTFELSTLAHQYGSAIANYTESPYGRLVLTNENGQYTFWESGTPTFSTFNIMSAEEKVHYPLSQLDSVEDVLLVSGGLGETLGEISKHDPRRIDYVELDPALIAIALQYGLMGTEEKVTIIPSDGRSYITDTENTYSAVILDLPEPDTFQLNRFYTREFFASIKRILRDNGVLSFSLLANPDYLSDISLKKLSSIYNTVKTSFQNVLLIPGEETYFLASDARLSADIPLQLKKKSIPTTYVEGFFYGNVTEDRMESLSKAIGSEGPVNEDLYPRVMTIMFKEWFQKHGTSPTWFIAVLSAIACFYLVAIRREEYVLFSTGFAVMGAEMLVLFTFQVIYGYIYLKVGVIITSFLFGLLPGSLLGNRLKHKGKDLLLKTEAGMVLLLMLYLAWIIFYRFTVPESGFFIFSATFSLLCGLQFPVAAEIIGEDRSPAAGLFAADLVGAGAGTLVIGTLIIPLLGIQSAVITLILIKAASTLVTLRI